MITDYSKMEFDPTSKKPLLVQYPKLKHVVGDVDDKMLRYVLLMYDQKSPLREYYPELSKRKTFAASIAGYDVDDDSIVELFDFKVKNDEGELEHNEEILELIIKYLKYQNNWVWSLIISNEQAFYEFNKRVLMPVDGQKDKDILQAIDIKTKIMQSQDEISQRLKKYFKELSGGDDDLEDAIVKRKRLSPESQAKR
jgi:hypothetical protein